MGTPVSISRGILMSEPPATEVFFYHLQNQPLERVLPSLLERTLERGWRAVVQASSLERVEALDTALWTYDDASFLPHGSKRDGALARHPIVLVDDESNPNGSAVRFLVDGATLSDFSGYVRAVYLFDGTDEEAVGAARQNWQRAKDAGHAVTYWQQDASGKWVKRA